MWLEPAVSRVMRRINRGVRIELLSAMQLKIGQNVPAGILDHVLNLLNAAVKEPDALFENFAHGAAGIASKSLREWALIASA